jgi:hypothetical protein
MLPELGTPFSELIRLIFIKAKHRDAGNYTDDESKTVISAINTIHDFYKGKGTSNPVDASIHGFIKEINRRFGLITKDDRSKYFDTINRRERRKATESGQSFLEDNISGITILPDEEDAKYDIRPAPSRRYRDLSIVPMDKKPDTEYMAKLDFNDMKKISSFRDMIERKFQKFAISEENAAFDFSFAEKIKETQRELDEASDIEKRFNIIVKLLQSMGSFVEHSGIYDILFHETVIVGVNTLGSIFTLLNQFKIQTSGLCNFVFKLEKDILSDDTGEFEGFSKVMEGDVLKIVGGPLDGRTVKALRSDKDAQQALNTVLRSKIAGKEMMRQLLENIFGFCSDSNGLVDVRIDENGLKINYSHLYEAVVDMLSSVKYFMEKLRGNISEEITKSLEEPETVGSIYWLESEFMDNCFNVLEVEDGSKRSFDLETNSSMEKFSISVDRLFRFLTQDFGQDDFNNYEEEIAKIVYFDTENVDGIRLVEWWAPRAALGAGEAEGEGKLDMVFGKNINKMMAHVDKDQMKRPVIEKISNQVLNIIPWNDTSLTEHRGIFALFNQLLYRYLGDSYDSTNEKMYRPLIEKFANGTFANAVLHDQSWNDFEIDIVSKDPDNFLFRSLANILRNILTNTKKNGDKLNLYDNLVDLPMVQKENLKGKLPYYIKLFSVLLKKSEFYRKLVQETRLSKCIPTKGVMIIKILTASIKGCQSIISCSDSVRIELNDSPVYFEINESFIKDFKSANNVAPFMPISTLTDIFSNARKGDKEHLYTMPFNPIGTDKFKFIYGARGILPNSDLKVGLENFSTFKELLEKSNILFARREKLDVDRASKFVGRFIQMVRFVNDTKHYKGQFEMSGVAGFFALHDIVGDGIKTSGIRTDKKMATYQISEKLIQKTILLTESNFREEQEKNILKHLQKTMTRDRNDIRILNILDMNIIPISVHAIMREVPLANIYNYSFTFDHMLTRMFRVPLGEGETRIEVLPSTGGRDMFVRLLVDPYARVTREDYRTYVTRIFRGNNMLDMGRPKFLSDQVFNKSLFGILTGGPTDTAAHDEAGPPGRLGNFVANRGQPGKLTYISGVGADMEKRIQHVDVGSEDNKRLLQNLGKLRFDTSLVRNLVFITNLYRVMRYKLWSNTSIDRSLIASGDTIIRPDLTEYIANESLTGLKAGERRYGQDSDQYGNTMRRL